MTRTEKEIRHSRVGTEPSQLAALVQESRVRVLNCSASGCLLETDAPFPVGTVATLSLSIGAAAFTETVRVVRCLLVDQTERRHHVAAEFLSLTPPYVGSLRHVMRSDMSELANVSRNGTARATKFLPDTDKQNGGRDAGGAENAEFQGI